MRALTALLIVAALVLQASPASAAVTERVDDPYGSDRIAAYKGLTETWMVDTWTVYSCDNGKPVADPKAAADAYNRQVTPIFDQVSSGKFRPRFVSGGVIKGDPDTCRTKAKGKGVILIFYQSGVFALATGYPPTFKVDNGALTIKDAPIVLVRSDRGNNGAGLMAHEIGHTLGWPHIPIAGPKAPSGADYGNMTNLMSGGDSVAAWNRYVSGWATATVHHSTSTYNLEPGEEKFIVVPTKTASRFYTVSAGPDGVEIHYVDQSISAGRAACTSQKKAGLPVCFGTGTRMEAIAPPVEQEDDGQQLPPWTPRKIGWTKVGDTIPLKDAGVTVHVSGLTKNPLTEQVSRYEVTIQGKAPALWKWGEGQNGDKDKDGDKGRGGDGDRDTEAPEFTDTSGSVFEEDIRRFAQKGITRGCNPPANTKFCPDDNVTRGQMAAFLARALDLKPSSASFVDVANHTFAKEISALVSAGITKGCNPPTNDRFCPDDYVTRGQMAAFLVRALGLKPGKAAFSDTKGSVFAADIAALADAGITKGCNPPKNTKFCPDDRVTRGQMAAFLVRALGD